DVRSRRLVLFLSSHVRQSVQGVAGGAGEFHSLFAAAGILQASAPCGRKTARVPESDATIQFAAVSNHEYRWAGQRQDWFAASLAVERSRRAPRATRTLSGQRRITAAHTQSLAAPRALVHTSPLAPATNRGRRPALP